MRLSESDVVVCAPPLFHTFGLVVAFLAAFLHSCLTVFPSDAFDAEKTIDAVIAEKGTVLHGVPTMFLAEMDVMRRRGIQLKTLRTGVIGGTPVPETVMERIKKEMRMDGLLIAYGTTETSPLTFMASLDDPIDRRFGSIGKVMPNTCAKIVNSNGQTLKRGERGELYISGYCLQKEYYGNPTSTREAMKRDSENVLWIRSGDEALIDEEGYGFITGRLKDIIIRGETHRFVRHSSKLIKT